MVQVCKEKLGLESSSVHRGKTYPMKRTFLNRVSVYVSFSLRCYSWRISQTDVWRHSIKFGCTPLLLGRLRKPPYGWIELKQGSFKRKCRISKGEKQITFLLAIYNFFGSSIYWDLTVSGRSLWAYSQSKNKQEKAVSAWKLYKSCIEVDVFHC